MLRAALLCYFHTRYGLFVTLNFCLLITSVMPIAMPPSSFRVVCRYAAAFSSAATNAVVMRHIMPRRAAPLPRHELLPPRRAPYVIL